MIKIFQQITQYQYQWVYLKLYYTIIIQEKL